MLTSILSQFITFFSFLDIDIAELIRVIAENCPDETIAAFIMTYGVFIVAIILVVVVLVKTIKKMGINEHSTEAEIHEFKTEISAAIASITRSAAATATEQAKVSNDIKNEIRANNDATMQLLISFGLANGMSYTDINNTITKAKNIYAASSELYSELEQEVEKKKQTQQEEYSKIEAELKAKAEAETKAKEQYKEDLASIKI